MTLETRKNAGLAYSVGNVARTKHKQMGKIISLGACAIGIAVYILGIIIHSTL